LVLRALTAAVILSFVFALLPPPVVSAESAPGPREPLTFRDSGLYGGWNEYFVSPECPFNWFIIQAVVANDDDTGWHGKQGESSWNDWLRRARRQGKRIIADVFFWGGEGATIETYKRRFDRFLQHVDIEQLYAITLAEENYYWGDRDFGVLEELYRYVKGKYDVPVWQWYSPYAGVPGFGWPQLPADGWAIDEYARRGDTFEPFIRKYAVHQLPLFQIIWAAPLMKSFDWANAGDPAFDEQLAICRKYDVPCAYFCWEGHGNVWGWSPDAKPESKAVFQRVLDAVAAAKKTPPNTFGVEWDRVPPAPAMTMQVNEDNTVSYEDPIEKAPRFMDDATIRGFANLRWDGGPLELRPRRPGPCHAELTYHLTSPFPMRDLVATASVQQRAAPGAQVMLRLSADGKHWRHVLWPATPMKKRTKREDQRISLRVGGVQGFDDINELWLRIELRSTKKTSVTPVLRLRNLRVSGVCTPPEKREILLVPDADGKVVYEDGVASHALRFTAEFDNVEQIEWQDGRIGIHGLRGHGDTVTVRQKFVCESPLKLIRVASRNFASTSDYGSWNRLAVSLDGKKKLVEKVTKGRFNGNLELDLGDDVRFGAVREFWVHMDMCNNSGDTRIINAIYSLKVEAQTAP